ncbi:MAG TPA: DEAD/DEAH box helicase [Acidimicrobiales bacterium]|nr:DEAD/DEAH box helicase [Acidimicrobiales bacterium]
MSDVTFASLGVDEALVDALSQSGVIKPFAIQGLTIADALAGRDVCGQAKTGSGKTLAFGLPLLQRTAPGSRPGYPRALVLVPTRELAVQVADVLTPLAESVGLTLRAVYGGTDLDADIRAFRKTVDVVIATPGRLIDLGNRGEIHVTDVGTIVLDEADRMADMGFLPQVEWFLRRMTHDHQTFLFSATLDNDVDHLMKAYMKDPVVHTVESKTVTVDEMTHRFLFVHEMDKARVAATISKNAYRTLIFTRTKRGADRLVADLKQVGVKASPLHGDLRQNARERALSEFSEGKLPVLVATDVAARGIHVDGIDVVIHYDPPEDHKTYLHRSGRTARAGESGLVVTLVLWNQQLEVEKLQKRIGVKMPIPEVFSNDPRLTDLAAWDPVNATENA